MDFISLLGLTLGLAALYAVLESRRKRARGPLPPGPTPMPIVGNIKDLPPNGKQDWVHWLKHKTLYGPISSITAMGQTIVIVNDPKIAVDLLTKRSAIHSSRPRMTFASEMVGWEDALAFQGYTDRFRAYRKAIQPSFGSEWGVAQFTPLQEVETRRFLFRVLKDTARLLQHIQTEAGAVILNIAYGYRIEPFERDNLVHIANEAMDEFGKATVPGAWLVDVIPILKYIPSWFPGAGFKRTANLWREHLSVVAERPYAFAGFPESGSEEEIVAKWTSASLYTGGADTEEIERVVGPGQLPKVADRVNLPYINAVVKEVLRWHPVAPMGLPHMSTADDTYDEYLIPKGSIILPNIWAMMHDPEVYPNPMEFQPERFLGEPPAPDPHTLVFGFGRRVCPGRFLADNTVFLSVAQSLAVFKISKDTQGDVEVTTPHFEPGVISHPSPFACEITPRSPQHEALILSVERDHLWEESDAAELQKVGF